MLEIDGSVHDSDEAKEYDEYRTSVFESRGIRTYRLRNEQCDKQHLEELIEIIIMTITSPSPPLHFGKEVGFSAPPLHLERGSGGEV